MMREVFLVGGSLVAIVVAIVAFAWFLHGMYVEIQMMKGIPARVEKLEKQNDREKKQNVRERENALTKEKKNKFGKDERIL